VHRDSPSPEAHAPPLSGSAGDWSIQELTGFLAMVSSAEDERTASTIAVKRAAEALGAEVAALLRRGEVAASTGFAATRWSRPRWPTSPRVTPVA
jgi:hypothetical protein